MEDARTLACRPAKSLREAPVSAHGDSMDARTMSAYVKVLPSKYLRPSDSMLSSSNRTVSALA